MNELKWLSRVGRLFNHFLANFPLLDRYFREIAGFRGEILLFSSSILLLSFSLGLHSE